VDTHGCHAKRWYTFVQNAKFTLGIKNDRWGSMENDLYLNSLELEDKYTKEPTVWNLAQAFPDSRRMVMRFVYDLEQELKVYDEWIEKHPFNEMFKKIDIRYIRVQDLRKFLNFTKPSVKGRIDRSDIERAKCVPIQELYDFNVAHETLRRTLVMCPLHNEKTASMFIYKDNNSFYCYGCHCGGDSISFIMKLHGVDFITAIKKLGGRND